MLLKLDWVKTQIRFSENAFLCFLFIALKIFDFQCFTQTWWQIKIHPKTLYLRQTQLIVHFCAASKRVLCTSSSLPLLPDHFWACSIFQQIPPFHLSVIEFPFSSALRSKIASVAGRPVVGGTGSNRPSWSPPLAENTHILTHLYARYDHTFRFAPTEQWLFSWMNHSQSSHSTHN